MFLESVENIDKQQEVDFTALKEHYKGQCHTQLAEEIFGVNQTEFAALEEPLKPFLQACMLHALVYYLHTETHSRKMKKQVVNILEDAYNGYHGRCGDNPDDFHISYTTKSCKNKNKLNHFIYLHFNNLNRPNVLIDVIRQTDKHSQYSDQLSDKAKGDLHGKNLSFALYDNRDAHFKNLTNNVVDNFVGRIRTWDLNKKKHAKESSSLLSFISHLATAFFTWLSPKQNQDKEKQQNNKPRV